MREREIDPKEANGYIRWLAGRWPDTFSPYHRTIHATLGGLLGRHAPAPNPDAWKALLKE